LISAIVVLTLLLTVLISLQIPAVQTKVAQYAVTELNDTFGTKINVERVDIDFFGDVNLYGVSTQDNHNLEFIDIDRIQVKVSIWGIIRNPNRLTLKKVTLVNPTVKVITYKDEKLSNFLAFIDKFSSEEKKEKSDFRIRGAIEIINGNLLIRNQNLAPEKQTWIDSEHFNALIENFRFEDEEIWADLKRMGFDAKKNGEDYNVQNLAAEFHYSKNEIRFDNLNIKTSDTDLNGNLVFSYDSQEELKDFANKVQWDLVIEDDSKVNFKDIRYFVDNFDKNSSVEVLGKVTGTLNDLQLNEFQLSGDGAFIAAKELNLTDMTDGEKIVIDSKSVKLKTSYGGLNQLLPTFIAQKIPDFLNRFGTVDYAGDFNLNPEEITLDGNAITSLGDADMQVLLQDYRGNMKYSGTLIADDINIEQITEVKELGFVKGRIDFRGQGTDIKTLSLTADGKLVYFDLMEKRYRNVTLDGKINNQKFTGFLSIQDPQLNANYDGTFDFAQKPYKLDFTSNVKHINLDYLGLTKDLNAHARADIKGDFSFSNLDDFLGNLEIENFYFTSKRDTLDIAQVNITSSAQDGIQNLELEVPGYLQGEINGQFKLSQLPDALMNAVGSTTLMTYEAKTIDPGQNFTFYFEVEQDLFNIFDPRIKVAPGTIIDGQVDADANTLVAELSSTEIGFDGINVYNPLINIDTNKNTEQIYVRNDSLQAKGVMLYNVDIHTTPIQDSLLVKTKFQIGKENPVDFDLNLFHTTDENKNLVFGFSPSTIRVDSTSWHLNPNNDINSNRVIVNFKKNYYELQGLLLESEEQKLLLDGYYASNTDYKLNADLQQLVLSKIIPKGLLGNLEIDGIANGNINVVRTKDEFKPLMELKIDQLALNKYGLGDLGMNGAYNVDQNIFDLELFLEQQQVQVLYVNGYIDNKPETPEINLVASLDDLNFNFVEAFLSAAMSNVRGMVSGNMRFTGPIDSPDFEGILDLNNLGFTVDYLNVDYSFDGVNTVDVSKQSGGQGIIALDNLKFRDTKYNSKGTVDGSLLFHDFASWYLSLAFKTDNLLVMNTNPALNDLFYGKVFGAGVFTLEGPPERLDIEATATVNDGSEFTINTGATKVEGGSDLVRFIPEGEKEEDDGRPKGMNIDLDISASPATTINLIFDPISGDMVTANGSTQNLKFNLNRAGNMTINGTYTLESGVYKLRQISLLNKDFDIQQGSYVSWGGGNAFEADMNITATYEKTVSNVGEYLGTGYSQAYDVVLGIVITESLQDPQMDFTLTIPKAGTDVQSMIDYKFNLDPDEKMIQFGSILLLGKFITDSQSVLTAGATSTGAGIALRQLGGIINSLIAIRGLNIDVDYVQGSEMSNTADRAKVNLSLDISPRWTFNGEAGVAVGGSSNIDNTTTVETEVQWDISKQMDKSMVINFFTRPANFGVQNFGGAGNFQSFGAGIIYKTSFDRLSEIFKKPEKPSSAGLPETEDEDFPSFFDQMEKKDSIEIKLEQNDSVIEKSDSIPKKEVSQKIIHRKKENSLVRFK